MTFLPEIDQRIAALGGTVTPCDGTIGQRLQAVDFSQVDGGRLLFARWAEPAELSLLDAVAAEPERVAELVGYPKLEWDVRRFTPFTPGTPDHEEWDGYIPSGPLVKQCGVASPTVWFLGFSEGWPNHFFVIGEDPDPANPTIYTTDHEVYFSEVEKRGDLRELLASVLTPAELAESAREVVERRRNA